MNASSPQTTPQTTPEASRPRFRPRSKHFWMSVVVFLILVIGLFYGKGVWAESYLGADIGVGSASGTSASEDSGLVLGATAGYQITPEFGVGATYLHSALGLSGTETGVSVSQFLLEANVFSLLLLQGGLHVGAVHSSISGFSTDDMGYGAHIGFDLRLTDRLSAGLGAYWTYVTQNNDKHSLFNFMIPLKVWF